MQMQEGIGRGGYRLLALVFAGLGGLGIIATLAAFGQTYEGLFKWLGFALTSVALVALLGLVLVILAPARVPRPQPEPEAEPEMEDLPEATGSDADLGVEYVEPAPAPEPEPVVRGPPPRVQPPPPVFVHPPSRPKDAKGWPERKGPTGVTRREAAESTFTSPEPPVPKPAGAKEPPLIMARTAASAESAGLPDNVSVGKCGNCGVLLMAPKKRPIRLQCPRCERVHTLA